jgi:type III pantothenate kinase
MGTIFHHEQSCRHSQPLIQSPLMLLAIDIGNTNITMGLWDGRHWQHQWRLRTVHEKTIDEYGIELNVLLRTYKLDGTIERVVIASVVPALTPTFAQTSQRYLGQTAVLVNHTLNTGITIDTDRPGEVGVDRLVNAVAAHYTYPGPSIVIDMGTATKFDIVTAGGSLCGGVIAPGLRLAADSLTQRAAQLRGVALEAPPHVIGRNTVHAIQSGLIFGYASLIEGMITRLKAAHPDRERPLRIIGTGGQIELVRPHLSSLDVVDPWLTLTGLRLISDRLLLKEEGRRMREEGSKEEG